MTLKRAASHAAAPWARTSAEEAMRILEDAIVKRGRDDAYVYHVIGSQGLSWIRRAYVSTTDRGRELGRLLAIVKEGKKFHPRAKELAQLADDIEKEYLLTAVH
jgi:hypothetical protein